MLLLTSKGGSGKSVLTRRVFERRLSGSDASHAEEDYFGASYFCSYTDAAINSEEVVLKSILHQLVQANPRCGSVVRECVTDANRPDQKKYDKGTLRNALNAVLAMPSMQRTFIAVDAVDELGVAMAADLMRSLSLAVDQLCETQPASRVRIFVSARPNHFRLRQSDTLQQLSMTDDIVNRDIQVYLEVKIDDLADRNDGFAAVLSPEIRRRIVDSIIRTAGGMFLAAELAWDEFGRGLLWNDDIVAQKLQHIERAAPGLVSFYEKTVARIDKAEIDDALAIFSVLAAAARPLSEQELGTILSMARVTTRRIRHSSDFQPYQGLAFIVENKLPDLLRFQDDDRVTFVHLSFKDFFESKAEYEDDIEWGRQAIARSCLEYIQLDDLLVYGKRTTLKPKGTSWLSSRDSPGNLLTLDTRAGRSLPLLPLRQGPLHLAHQCAPCGRSSLVALCRHRRRRRTIHSPFLFEHLEHHEHRRQWGQSSAAYFAQSDRSEKVPIDTQI
jgi:hypothetical protein